MFDLSRACLGKCSLYKYKTTSQNRSFHTCVERLRLEHRVFSRHMDRLLRFHAVQLQLAALLEIPRTDPRLANRLARRAVACKKRLSFSTFPDLCPEPVLASAHFMYKLAQKRTRRFRMCTVVAHHQHARCLSDIAGYLRLLIEVRGEPLIVMISNLVAEELRRVLIQADEALLQAADGDRGGSV